MSTPKTDPMTPHRDFSMAQSQFNAAQACNVSPGGVIPVAEVPVISTPLSRACDEQRELGERMNKLSNFMRTEAFMQNLPNDARERLIEQLDYMHNYYMVLTRRIFLDLRAS